MKENIYKSNLPDLLEIQRSSFCWFLTEGLGQELNHFSSIYEINERRRLKIYGNEFTFKQPLLTPLEAKERNVNYSIRIYLSIELIDTGKDLLSNNNNTSIESIEPTNYEQLGKQKILIGEIPLMTEKCTFIINGCERVVISQLIRSPGVYYKKEKKKNKLYTYSAKVITKRGSWLEFELYDNSMWVKIDKKHKIPINWFLGALDLTNEEIYQTVTNYKFLIHCMQTMKNDLEKKRLNLFKKLKKRASLKNTKADLLAIYKVRELIYSRILNAKYYDLGEVGRIKINKKLELNLPLTSRTLTPLDILKIIDYLINIKFYSGEVDDIDSLTNRRVRCVGELIQLQMRVGLNRIERNILEKLSSEKIKVVKLTSLVNPKPLIAVIKEFFGSSQLSQFMDETNPLAEITHKRRISALGPGGLSTDHVSFAARDIHPTQYGRLCPIETPEGQNAGLVSSLASHAKINHYGFIETPFFEVVQSKVLKDVPPIYLTAEQEKEYKIAAPDTHLTSTGYLKGDLIPVRYNHEFTQALPNEVNLIAISTIQIISIAAALIPFLEHDDANRALMGSNMQRQAVPLLYPQIPIVGTGLEGQIATDSFCGVVNYNQGIVEFVTAEQIIIQGKDGQYKRYFLEKYRRSNQDTCVNQKPIVWPGQSVHAGEMIADGPGIESGELSLGQNLTVAYMPWEGFNFEDAIVVSERLVSNDLFTSIHIEKYEVEIRQTQYGPEEMTTEIPNVHIDDIRHLDTKGVVYKGAFVEGGDILVGKITPKGESEELPESKLLRAIFGDKSVDVHDSSLRVPNGISGRVIDILVFSKEEGDDIPLNAINVVRIFIAERRKIKIGDKISGRHGNKGIISKILPLQDMPFLPNGTVVDVILNPLGVPSRMNVGQIFECLLGFAGEQLHKRFKILPFDEMYSAEASRILINTKLKEAAERSNNPWLFNSYCPGKVFLRDGRTGEIFDNPILVGKSYILKLIHLVDDKMHARSTGPYSLVTQQPVGGRSQQGGQRFGEMEVWALEAFGAAYTLQELLTIKSDDIEGRNEVLNAIVKGESIPKPGVPESFKVLLRELQALGLDIMTYKFQDVMGEVKGVEVDLMAFKPSNNYV